jgi:hypothetical protein
MINHYGPRRLGALDPSVPAKTLLKALPAGTLQVELVADNRAAIAIEGAERPVSSRL